MPPGGGDDGGNGDDADGYSDDYVEWDDDDYDKPVTLMRKSILSKRVKIPKRTVTRRRLASPVPAEIYNSTITEYVIKEADKFTFHPPSH